MKKFTILLMALLTLQGCSADETVVNPDHDDPGDSMRIESTNTPPDDLER